MTVKELIDKLKDYPDDLQVNVLIDKYLSATACGVEEVDTNYGDPAFIIIYSKD